MPLSSVLDIARSSLATTSEMTQVASRNLANANNSGATRKIANLATTANGARIASIARSTTVALQDGVVGATSSAARLDVIVSGLERLDLSGGDSQSSATPASRLGQLQAALQIYSASPANVSLATNVVSSASDLVSTLHSWARNVETVRLKADQDVRDSVDELNKMLGQVGELNGKIVNGTIAGSDVTDQLDQRDALVANIAQVVGVTVVSRSNNDIALYSDSGLTLFDVSPRTVAMQPGSLVDGTPGAAVMIDGVPATGANSVMPITTGRLAGLIELRDSITTTMATQLDEIASGLVRAFAESDQGSTPTLPQVAGLFQTSGGSTAVPADAASLPGLAKSITVNANVDPARGGDLMRLRDGGISDPSQPAFAYNHTHVSGFSDRIDQLVQVFGQAQARAPNAQLSSSSTLLDFSAASIGWLQGQRQTNTDNSSYASVLLQRSQDALSKVSGINIDDELTQLMELERTYQASAKLITTVDSMFGSLMQAVG